MPTLETLTQADLNKVIKSKSISRAYGYTHQLQNAQRAGSTLSALVGSRKYQVEVQVEPGGILARCSCLYDWGGYCKHVAAVLLKWVDAPGTFTVKETATPKLDDFPLPATPVEPPATSRPPQVPFWLTANLAQRQTMDQKRLSTWLEQLKVQDLRTLAQKRGWPVKGTKKADIVQQLIGPMTDPAEILRTTRTLDAEHQQVLQAMMITGAAPKITIEDLTRVAETWGKLSAHKKVTTYTRHLSELGLAISGELEFSYPPRPDFVPRAIARHMPPVLSEVFPAAEDSAELSAAEPHLADPLALVRAAHQVVFMLEQQTVALRPPMPRPDLVKFYPTLAGWDYDPHELLAAQQKGKLQPFGKASLTVPPPAYALPDEAITRLAPLVGDEARLEFTYQLLVAAGIFQPGSPVTIWPEVKEQFLRRTEPAQRAVLARTYFAMTNWSELWDMLRAEPKLQLRRSLMYSHLKPEQLRTELTYFRQLILGALACLPHEQWLELNNLVPLMRRVWPRFDRHAWQESYYYYAQDTSGWFLARTQTSQPLSTDNALSTDNDSDWTLGQWNFIRYMITGPLHWLGLADLSVKNGVVVALRLHGLGDLFWDRVEAPEPPAYAVSQSSAIPPAEAVNIDNFTIMVNPAAISTPAHTFLDKIARLDEVTPEKFIYNLNPQPVHQSFEAGETLDSLLAEWERLLPLPPPEPIRNQLEAWWQGYGQVRLYQNVTVIEFDDDYALAEMKAVTSLAEHLLAEISPRLVLVDAAVVNTLTAQLEKAGYTPKQTDQI